MPEVITTLATVWSLMTFATAVHDGEMDVYLNGNQIVQGQQERCEEIINQGEQRRQQILLAANERREYILSQTTLK